MGGSPYDCRTCGACCSFEPDDSDGFADVTVDDIKRLSRHARQRLVTVGGGWSDAYQQTPAVFREEFGKCCGFLRGAPGRRVNCGIYTNRPDVCREFRPGSARCVSARLDLGIEERP